jgi:hypothetical protein
MFRSRHSRRSSVQGGPWPRLNWVMLALFAGLVAFTGGASRFDAAQIIPLRSLSLIFLIMPFFFLDRTSIRCERFLFLFLSCYVALVVGQLLPLPEVIWQSLPGRAELSRIDMIVGLEQSWRPISLSPIRGWNALGSLLVPVAGFVLAIALRVPSKVLLQFIAGLGLLNATLGLAQVATGKLSIFYLYEVTNRGSPVGIFANENHSAIFAACSMLVLTLLMSRARVDTGPVFEKVLYPAIFFIIFFVSLVSGSRAGFVAILGSALASMVMLFLSPRAESRGIFKRSILVADSVHRYIPLAMTVIVISLTAITFIWLDRTPALRDILAKDSFADLRWSFWPILIEMVGDHWVIGTGIGSFERVYQIYEPSGLLMPLYVNQAHNDWGQFILEGGFFAVALLIVLLIWLTNAIRIISLHSTIKFEVIVWAGLAIIIGAASMVDYPLRTPLFQLVSIWLLIVLSREVREIKAA